MKTDKQRFEGEYYTPLPFVREIHNRLNKLQDNYLEIPTWDPAAGKQNLTKEYKYENLFSSTLLEDEADFQYDFLNDLELPVQIEDILKTTKSFNFIVNPPYATSGNNKRDSESKQGVTFTKMRKIIQKDKVAKDAARNLAQQFLYRILDVYEKNTNITEGYIIWIDKTSFLSSSTHKGLRTKLFKSFDFVDGFMIDAGNFEGIKKGQWAISFSIFKLNRGKEVYNLDSGINTLNDFIRNDVNKKELTTIIPHLTSFLTVADKVKNKGLKDIISVLVHDSNNIASSGSSVYIINGFPTSNLGCSSITKQNFHKAIAGFCSRALIKPTPFNDKDEYMKPSSMKPFHKFKYDILENTEEGVVKVGEKEVYNLDSGVQSLNNIILTSKTEDYFPHLSSALTVNDVKQYKTSKSDFSLLCTLNNNISENQTGVYIINGASKRNASYRGINKNTLKEAVSLFSARRLIEPNVWNDKDEYMKPSDTILASDEYKQWNNDCIIYSLFDNQSFQSSLRQIEYQGKTWDIFNEFFYLPVWYMKELATEHSFTEMLEDIEKNGSKERFVYEELTKEGIDFHPVVLDLLIWVAAFMTISFEDRVKLHREDSSLHLNSWDAGFAQTKKILSLPKYKKEYKEFQELRNKAADYLRPFVYHFGFLYK